MVGISDMEVRNRLRILHAQCANLVLLLADPLDCLFLHAELSAVLETLEESFKSLLDQVAQKIEM